MKRRTYKSVQEFLKKTGMTQTALAQLTGIDRSHLCMMLAGTRRLSLDRLKRLARITRVPVENLVDQMLRDAKAGSDEPSDREVA